MLIVLIISCVITVQRFGVGVLEDNFVAQLSTHYKNSSEFMSFYGLLNCYLYTMAYVYSPANKEAHGKVFSYIYSVNFCLNLLILSKIYHADIMLGVVNKTTEYGTQEDRLKNLFLQKDGT